MPSAIILMLNVVPILATAGVTAWHGAGLWRARRRQAAGSELHVRIVGLFGVIAVLPAIFVALMASVALDRGLNIVFSERTTAIVQNSQSVAVAYLNELGRQRAHRRGEPGQGARNIRPP